MRRAKSNLWALKPIYRCHGHENSILVLRRVRTTNWRNRFCRSCHNAFIIPADFAPYSASWVWTRRFQKGVPVAL